MFRVIAVAWAVVFGLCVNSSNAAEFRANYVELATLVRAALKGAEIHLNNKPNDGLFALIGPKQSYIKLGTVEIPFDVPPHAAFGTNYYVYQVVSTKIAVAAVKGAVRVVVSLKAQSPDGAAIVAATTAFPWLRWRDAVIEIDFKPIKVAKGLTFDVTRVAMQGPFVAFCPSDGFATVACNFLSLAATKQQMVRVRTKVETALKERLNNTEIRDQFAEAVTKYLTFAKNDEIDIQIRDVRSTADGVVVSFCVNRC